MACGLRCYSSPSHLGAAGNYASLKGLNPCSLPSASSTSSFPVPLAQPLCPNRFLNLANSSEFGECV